MDRTVEDGIETSPVASTLLEIMRSRPIGLAWIVTPTALHEALTNAAGSRAKGASWPQSPRGLQNALKRLAPNLRKIGLTYTKSESHDREYRFYFEPCSMGDQAPNTPHTPEPLMRLTSSVGASGAHEFNGAHRYARQNEAHREAPTLKPSIDGASGVTGASGARNPTAHVEDIRI